MNESPNDDSMKRFYTKIHESMTSNADIFKAPYPTQKEFRQFIIDYYKSDLSRLIILDAGCGGTAVNSISCSLYGFSKIYAFDLNLDNINHVNKILKNNPNTKSIFLVNGSILSPPFKSVAFDFIICHGVIHHLSDPAAAIKQLYNILKPKGRLFVSLYCFENSWFENIVRVWRFFGKTIPYRVMHFAFHKFPLINNFVLDFMYVPILWVFKEKEAISILKDIGFSIEKNYCSAVDPFYGKSFFKKSVSGDGILRNFVCCKH